MIKKALYDLLNTNYVTDRLFQSGSSENSEIYFVMVDPNEISDISLLSEDSALISGPEAVFGSVRGFFDYFKFPFKYHFMFRTTKMMLNGSKWEDTPYFKKLRKMKSHDDAVIHLEKLRNLIKHLTEKGYLSQYQLGKLHETISIGGLKIPVHETIIAMGRNGKLIRLKGGRHRLAIAQNIGISRMPAILSLYHEKSKHLLPQQRRLISGSQDDFAPFYDKT